MDVHGDPRPQHTAHEHHADSDEHMDRDFPHRLGCRDRLTTKMTKLNAMARRAKEEVGHRRLKGRACRGSRGRRGLVCANVSDTIAMKLTRHKTRSVFDRYDITSEADLADASRRLDKFVGTVAGTVARFDADSLRQRVAHLQKHSEKFGGPPGDRTRDTVIKSHVLYH